MRSYRAILALFFVFSFILTGLSMAEDKVSEAVPISADSTHLKAMERPQIGGLKEFHDVLAPIWHGYLPDSNYQAVRESIPQLKEGMAKVNEASLPEYFQHVKAAFDEKRLALSQAVAHLDTVAQGKDNRELENAVEGMHSAFEQMVRVIAPRMQEIEDFHLVLYPLWHKALPGANYAAIKASVPDLAAKMEILDKAAVPEWLKDKESQIVEKRSMLKKAVDELVVACGGSDNEAIKGKLTVVHGQFRALDGVFE